MKAFGRRLAAVGLVALLAGVAGPSASGDFNLYGVTYFGNHLIQIDPTTQVGTDVGPLSTPMSPYGLSASNGKLYTFDSQASLIRQISPATGATLAGINIQIGKVLGQGGMALGNNGVGYLSSALDPTTMAPAMNLYRFDINAGTSSLVGHTGAESLAALALSQNGTLFGLGKDDGNLYTVNTSTAALTLVGNVAGTPGSPVESLTFSPTGKLFGTIDDRLYSINSATGMGTAIDADPTNDVGFSSISGLAFSAVPEPSSILLMGIGVGVALATSRRRWKARPSRV